MTSLKRSMIFLSTFRTSRLFLPLPSLRQKSSHPKRGTFLDLSNISSCRPLVSQLTSHGFLGTHITRRVHCEDNMTSEIPVDRNLDYESLLERKKGGGKIVDVREKKELLEDGTIPNSYHIPVGELPNALANLSKEEFKNKYGFEKPDVEDELIFSCRSGKRSLMAYSFAEKAGYKNIFNYSGGWLDWEKNAGKSTS